MTAEQSSRVNMFRAVKFTTDAHSSAWSTFSPFASAHSIFASKLNALDNAIALQSTDITGVTEEKNSLREDLVQACCAVPLHSG